MTALLLGGLPRGLAVEQRVSKRTGSAVEIDAHPTAPGTPRIATTKRLWIVWIGVVVWYPAVLMHTLSAL